jgi:hypothetical protein
MEVKSSIWLANRLLRQQIFSILLSIASIVIAERSADKNLELRQLKFMSLAVSFSPSLMRSPQP